MTFIWPGHVIRQDRGLEQLSSAQAYCQKQDVLHVDRLIENQMLTAMGSITLKRRIYKSIPSPFCKVWLFDRIFENGICWTKKMVQFVDFEEVPV